MYRRLKRILSWTKNAPILTYFIFGLNVRNKLHFYGLLLFRPGRGAELIVMSLSVCLYLSISQEPHTRTNFTEFSVCYLWPWLGPPLAGFAIRYVLPVLWMMSCCRIMSLWWRVTTTTAPCTGQHPVVYRLRPVLQPTVGAKTRRVPDARADAGGEVRYDE